MNNSKIVTFRANITIAIKNEVAYGLSNGIFRNDLVLFYRLTWP